jgi:osmotically-inducible protein OsmY
MYRKNVRRSFLLASFLIGCCSLLLAQTPAEQNPPSSDNTKMNQHDRGGNEPSAEQQQNGPTDRETTRQIRDAIVSDKALSADAHDVSVITQNGTVTLSGPVRSDEEKRVIEEKAAEIAGEINVISELTVKPNS